MLSCVEALSANFTSTAGGCATAPAREVLSLATPFSARAQTDSNTATTAIAGFQPLPDRRDLDK